MDKPLFVECHNALEYNYLFKDVDNMNFYSAKLLNLQSSNFNF